MYVLVLINIDINMHGDEIKLILCNLYKKLFIKLVSIKELYYDARPTKSQDIK